MSTLAAYLLAAMTAWYPAKTHDFTKVPREDTQHRYEQIANDLASVAMDPNEEPLFSGETGRAQTALVMLSFAGYESGGFAQDVDTLRRKGDGGLGVCLMQVHPPYANRVVDRLSCFHEGLRALHDSWAMCKAGTTADRLTGYTVGHCEAGERGAWIRVSRATRWWTAHAFSFSLAP
jgi:hypothetical protein